MITIAQVKQLRQETDVSVLECKKALVEAKGDLKKAKEILKKWGKDFAVGKTSREASQGVIASYIHPNKKIGVLLALYCESDFVAKSDGFQKLAHEICLQIAANREEIPLLEQPWIRDETKTIKDLINEYVAKMGENVVVKEFVKYEI